MVAKEAGNEGKHFGSNQMFFLNSGCKILKFGNICSMVVWYHLLVEEKASPVVP